MPTTIQLTAPVAGDIQGHLTKVDGQKVLVIESAGGEQLGVVRAKPNMERASRGDPKTLGTVLEAASGSWFLPVMTELRQKTFAVQDAQGNEVASYETSLSSKLLHAPGGDVTWERKRLGRPQYVIDGLYAASRTPMHTFVAGISHTPFKGQIESALVKRTDAALVLLLAAHWTMSSIDIKVAAQSSSS
jgi:hypothetical protein